MELWKKSAEMTQAAEEKIGKVEHQVKNLQSMLQKVAEATMSTVEMVKKRPRSEDTIVSAIVEEAKRMRVENQASLAEFEKRMRSVIEQSLKTAAEEKAQLDKRQYDDEKKELKEVLKVFMEENKKSLIEMENRLTGMIQQKALPSNQTVTAETLAPRKEQISNLCDSMFLGQSKKTPDKDREISELGCGLSLGLVSATKDSFYHLARNLRDQKPILIDVHAITKKVFKISVVPSNTVHDVKVKIEKEEGIPAYQQRFVYRQKLLHDDWTVEHYDIQNGAVIYLILKFRGVADSK